MVVCAALLPTLLLRDFTPANELRYLSIADEALRNHTFFAFTNHGTPYADKPPLYLWVVMLCRWLTGGHRLWLLSLFSLLPAWGVIRTMEGWTIQELDGEGRVLAGLMLQTCGLFLGAALTLRMDMLMCFFIIRALYEFWSMCNGNGRGGRAGWLFPAYIFLAVFTKGPLGLFIPLVGTAVFLLVSGRIGQFFHYWDWRTLGVLASCCSLWFCGVYTEGGTDYLHNLLVHQTIDRAVNSFHHDGPFWYYAVSFWYSLVPWSLLAAGVLVTLSHPRSVRSDLQRFFLAVTVSTFLLLSCISAKLQVYLLPCVPFIIYSTAMSLPRFHSDVWWRICLSVPAAVFTVSFPVLLIAVSRQGMAFLNERMIYVAAILLSLTGIHTLYLLCENKRRKIMTTAIYRMGAGILLAVFTGGWALPGLNAEIGYGTLCGKALELSQRYGITDFCTWHVPRSENMDIYLHRPVKVIHPDVPPSSGKERPFILLTRKRDLTYFPGRETLAVGPFAVVACP